MRTSTDEGPVVGPTSRWTPLRYHPEQQRLWSSPARFCIVEGPRRGGKTMLAKRAGVRDGLRNKRFTDFLVTFLAPTRDHAKNIFWDDLKALIPRDLIASVRESDLEVKLITGATYAIIGMDKPPRIEGRPIDRFYADEVAEWRVDAWERNLRPALSTPGRPGGGWFFGVPRPNAQFLKLANLAKSGTDPEYDYFHWRAEGVLDPEEIESARRTMDPHTFAQEYEAERVAKHGRAYYCFERRVHGIETLPYKPRNPLIFCFDFNVEPGTASVAQEHRFRERPTDRQDRPEVADEITAFIGEVFIPRDSNTPSVCRKLIADWGKHEGPVYCYGDPAGGARTTKLDGDGTDWTVIRSFLKPVFGERLSIRGPGTEPSQRLRLNALNTRFRTVDGKVHCLIDPVKCPKLLEDCEETTIKPGSDGEIYKPSGHPYSHFSDGAGYFILRAHPITGPSVRSDAMR